VVLVGGEGEGGVAGGEEEGEEGGEVDIVVARRMLGVDGG